MSVGDPSLEAASPADGDIYEDYPEDEHQDVENPQIAFDIAKAVRTIGNKLLSEGKTDFALQKYQSEYPVWIILCIGFSPRFIDRRINPVP